METNKAIIHVRYRSPAVGCCGHRNTGPLCREAGTAKGSLVLELGTGPNIALHSLSTARNCAQFSVPYFNFTLFQICAIVKLRVS